MHYLLVHWGARNPMVGSCGEGSHRRGRPTEGCTYAVSITYLLDGGVDMKSTRTHTAEKNQRFGQGLISIIERLMSSYPQRISFHNILMITTVHSPSLAYCKPCSIRGPKGQVKHQNEDIQQLRYAISDMRIAHWGLA